MKRYGMCSMNYPFRLAPASQRIASPYELEARYSAKRETHWVGYKVHLTEACHADAPNLIVNVETRPATEPDHEATEIVHDHLSQRDYSPAEHFVDAGYMSVEQAIEAQEHHQINLMGPVPMIPVGKPDSTAMTVPTS